MYGIRQMDDLMIWVATNAKDERTKQKAKSIKRHILRKDGVYKGGLELEEEKVNKVWIHKEQYYLHEFAGTKIKIRKKKPEATCTTLNKNIAQIGKKGTQKRARYPPWESYTSTQSKKGVIIGTLHRIKKQNTTVQLATNSMIDNYKEYKALKYPDKFYMDIMHKISKQTHTDQTIRCIAKDTHTLIQARVQTNTH